MTKSVPSTNSQQIQYDLHFELHFNTKCIHISFCIYIKSETRYQVWKCYSPPPATRHFTSYSENL